MFVKVFIRRPIKNGKASPAFTLLKELRSHAVNQQGYISGETLINTDDPQEMVVLSTWHSMEKREEWRKSKVRTKIDNQLLAIQIKPTSYRTYASRKYRISVKKRFPDALD